MIGQSKIISACLEIMLTICFRSLSGVYIFILIPELFHKEISRDVWKSLCRKTFVVVWLTIMKN